MEAIFRSALFSLNIVLRNKYNFSGRKAQFSSKDKISPGNWIKTFGDVLTFDVCFYEISCCLNHSDLIGFRVSISISVLKILQDGRSCTPKCYDMSLTIDTSNNDVYSKMLFKFFFHIPCAVRFLVVEFCHLIHKIVHSYLLVIVFLMIFCNLEECLLPRLISWPAFPLSFASVSLMRKRYLLPRPKMGTANLVINCTCFNEILGKRYSTMHFLSGPTVSSLLTNSV